MEQLDYFDGERLVSEYEIDALKKNVTLTCREYERWKDVLSYKLKCGSERKFTLKKREGIEESEKETVKAAIEGSLGIKGLAKVAASLSESCDHQITYQKSVEETSEFTFKAPECGSKTLSVYQMQKLFRLNYVDTGWFHRDEWNTTITVWLNRIIDDTKVVKNDPDCGCSADPDLGADGFMKVHLGTLALFLGFQQKGGELAVPGLNCTLQGTPAEVENRIFQFSRKHLPPHLLFLSGAAGETFDGLVTSVEMVKKESQEALVFA